MSGKKKNAAPRQVRAKKGTSGKKSTVADKKALGAKYVAAQGASPSGAKVATEATAVGAALSTLSTLELARPPLVAALDKNTGDTLTAETTLDGALDGYARASAKVAGTDASVLASLGVDEVAKRSAETTGPAPVPTDATLKEGKVSGSALGKWKRPPQVGAFQAQYKLEPLPNAPAGTPAPDWMPPGDGFATTKVEWVITGLPPAAALRLRVRAIGAEVGPWCDEVLGKAR